MTIPSPPRQDTLLALADQATTNRFLALLFDGSAGGFVEFRFFTREDKSKRASASVYLPLPLEEQLLDTEILSRNGQQLIAFGPARRFRLPARGRAGRDHDVLEVGCIWGHLEHSRAKGGAVEVLRRIRDFPLRPSAIVSLGFAHQVYFVFHEPLRDDGMLAWGDLMLGLSFALAAGVPPALSQTAPLPGTASLLSPQPISCTVSEEYSSWTRYGVDEVEAALRTAARKQDTSVGLVGTKSSPSNTIEQLRQRGLSTALLQAILTGRGAPSTALSTPAVSGESGTDFRLAYALFTQGCTEEEIKAIFRAHPHGCGLKWAQKRDGEKYFDSLLRKVTARFGETQGFRAADHLQQQGYEDLSTARLPPGYAEHEDGSVWFHPPVSDESRNLPQPIKVCNSPIYITQIREDIDTGQIAVVISFQYLGRRVSASIPRSQMADARQLVASLSGMGAPINSINSRHITAYLAAYEHTFAPTLPRKIVASSFGRGREDGPFIFPNTSPDIEFIPAGAGDASLYRAFSSRRGSFLKWLDIMREVANETLIIPQVAILAALVPPLQRKIQIPNFILDLHGTTSTGKSTSLKLAASVYGSPHDPDSLIQQWMSTSVAVEQVAAMCSELPIFLDDAQHCSATLKRSLIYMIANGRGKGRGTPEGRGGIRATPAWHTVAISTSEEPLYEASPHEGARGRILSVGGHIPPFRPGMASLVQAVEKEVAACHGHAGELYIRHLNGWPVEDWMRWQRRYSAIRGELVKSSSSDLIGRASGYVAAIQLAAEIARPLMGLPFQPEVVGAWLKLHLEEQQQEQNMVLLALRVLADYYVAHVSHFAGDGRRASEKRAALYGLSKDQQYVAYLRSTIEAVFKPRKWNMTALLNKLADSGAIFATEKDRHTKKVSVEGVQHRMVCIKWPALFN